MIPFFSRIFLRISKLKYFDRCTNKKIGKFSRKTPIFVTFSIFLCTNEKRTVHINYLQSLHKTKETNEHVESNNVIFKQGASVLKFNKLELKFDWSSTCLFVKLLLYVYHWQFLNWVW